MADAHDGEFEFAIPSHGDPDAVQRLRDELDRFPPVAEAMIGELPEGWVLCRVGYEMTADHAEQAACVSVLFSPDMRDFARRYVFKTDGTAFLLCASVGQAPHDSTTVVFADWRDAFADLLEFFGAMYHRLHDLLVEANERIS